MNAMFALPVCQSLGGRESKMVAHAFFQCSFAYFISGTPRFPFSVATKPCTPNGSSLFYCFLGTGRRILVSSRRIQVFFHSLFLLDLGRRAMRSSAVFEGCVLLFTLEDEVTAGTSLSIHQFGSF